MAGLIKRVFVPSVSYENKISYMTSLELNQAFSTDTPSIALGLEAAIQMLTTQSTRYMGLQFLEQALRQNSERFFCSGKWTNIILQILKDPHAESMEKKLACRILVLTIPYNMDNEHFLKLKEELIAEIYPILLERIKENVEWTEEACKLVKTCLKSFPSHLHVHQNLLLKVILLQATYSVSSKSFEVLAECFCEIPYCTKDNNVTAIKDCWVELYNRTVMSIDRLRIECLGCTANDEDANQRLEIEGNEFNFEKDDPEDLNTLFMNNFRRFVNLSKCLAKLLSVKPRYPVKVPVLATIRCFIHLYTVRKKEKMNTAQEFAYVFLLQMQLAGLSALEALILNTNTLAHTITLKDCILVAFRSSASVSELRVAVWKLLHLWLESVGRGAAREFIRTFELIQGLLTDISLETYESQSSSVQAHKSKKNAANLRSKSILLRNTQLSVCEAALRSLESLIYSGSLDFSKTAFQEICLKVFQICHAINTDPIPFPYSNESCRRTLYSIVLAISTVSQPSEVRTIQRAISILSRIRTDPSFKVRKLSNKAAVISRLQIYPKRPIPFSSDSSNQKKPSVSEERYSEWVSDAYVQNVVAENDIDTSENMNANIEHSFQSQREVEISTSEDYMDIDPEYNEQVIENQCNGEGLSIPSSSQGQEDDESEEEEEEEEEDERDYGEEDINADESEIYIPETTKVQNLNSSVQIKSESVKSISEPEYEEITTHSKFEESNKDKIINGDDIVTHGSMSSLAQQTISNENGVLDRDDDDEEEDDDEDEDDDGDLEEENEEVEEEKCNPPPKKQKIETICEPEEVKPRSPSPTEESAKAILLDIFPSEEDTRSGKSSLSTS